MSRRLLSLLTALLPVALVACLPGPETLLERASAEVIVTGAEAGDQLRLEVAGTVKEAVVEDGEPLHLYLPLPSGTHPARLEAWREASSARLCAGVLLEVVAGEQRAFSIDLRAAAPCPDDGEVTDGGDNPADAGHRETRLVYLRSDEHEEGCMAGSNCRLLRITAHADGALEVIVGNDGDDEREAWIPENDLALLEAAALSAEADRLFTGADPDCTEPRPEPGPRSFLERRRRTTAQGVGTITERVDVTGCGGTAQELRVRLRFLRELLLHDEE